MIRLKRQAGPRQGKALHMEFYYKLQFIGNHHTMNYLQSCTSIYLILIRNMQGKSDYPVLCGATQVLKPRGQLGQDPIASKYLSLD